MKRSVSSLIRIPQDTKAEYHRRQFSRVDIDHLARSALLDQSQHARQLAHLLSWCGCEVAIVFDAWHCSFFSLAMLQVPFTPQYASSRSRSRDRADLACCMVVSWHSSQIRPAQGLNMFKSPQQSHRRKLRRPVAQRISCSHIYSPDMHIVLLLFAVSLASPSANFG